MALTTFVPLTIFAQNYAGNQQCQGCHSNPAVGGTQYTHWVNTLHSKNTQIPSDVTMRSSAAFIAGQSVSMGSSFGNAQVILSKVGNDFFAQVGAGGQTYRIELALGFGWKQRYLIKRENNHYLLPIQWNLKGYMDNSTGSWTTYDAGTWFDASGNVKPLNNAFRAKSWEKDCMGCHAAVGFSVNRTINGSDTSWTGTWAAGNSIANMNVGCEYCHGPSASHFGGTSGTINPKNLSNKDRKIEVCGQCHLRTNSWRGAGLVGTHGYPKDEVNNRHYRLGDTLRQFVNLATTPNTSGGMGTWPDMVEPRQHRQQYQNYLVSKHYTTPFVEITCFTCHTMHRPNANKFLVTDSLTVGTTRFATKSEDNTLCLACHATHGPFANIQKAWVSNEPAFRDSIGRYVKLHTRHQTYDPLNLNNTGGNGRCVTCHMTKVATTTHAYDISTHTFKVIPPVRTIQFQGVSSPTQGMLNSCSYYCHRNPSGPTANVPTLGVGTDPSLTNWREATDTQLANALWTAWQAWGWTGVKQVASTVPETHSLSQNYPNPFNPSTTIKVNIAESGTIRLAVYNLVGQEVARLMDGSYAPGSYEVTWQGKDDDNIPVSSGVYLYRLDIGKTSITRKMLMLK